MYWKKITCNEVSVYLVLLELMSLATDTGTKQMPKMEKIQSTPFYGVVLTSIAG